MTTLTLTGVVEKSVPLDATMVNAPMVPLAARVGVQTTESPEAMIVVPGVTASPFLVSVPLETASMRKLGVAPALVSLAAARSSP